MSETAQTEPMPDIQSTVQSILDAIERDREKEILTRRFGLNGKRETLEQIGELLGITRERVRQLEKAILIRLKIMAQKGHEDLDKLESQMIRHLSEMGRVARLEDLSHKLTGKSDDITKAHVSFVAELAPRLSTLNENDNYHHAIAIRSHLDSDKHIRNHVDNILKTIKQHGEALTIDQLHEKANNYEHPDHVKAIASISKNISNLKQFWGLSKWPSVNPRNIRDKIFVVLEEQGKPMHFSDIAKAIAASDFARKDVTTQAIHNELIKDKRFVLIGRGIYALDAWGFSKGTVSDIIRDILAKSPEPLHRDEIVKQVLDHRQVKETTILLNLQSKPEFVRASKAMYTLAGKQTEATPQKNQSSVATA